MDIESVKLFRLANYKCEICGKSVFEYASPQLAHRIPQSKINIKKYGKKIIHHSKNLVAVCSLACNSKVSISNKPLRIEKLVKEITDVIGLNICLD